MLALQKAALAGGGQRQDGRLGRQHWLRERRPHPIVLSFLTAEMVEVTDDEAPAPAPKPKAPSPPKASGGGGGGAKPSGGGGGKGGGGKKGAPPPGQKSIASFFAKKA